MRQDPGAEYRSWERPRAPASPANAWIIDIPGSISGDRPFRMGNRQALSQPSPIFSGVVLAAQYQARPVTKTHVIAIFDHSELHLLLEHA